jgi:hypothetical protein
MAWWKVSDPWALKLGPTWQTSSKVAGKGGSSFSLVRRAVNANVSSTHLSAMAIAIGHCIPRVGSFWHIGQIQQSGT